MARLLTLTALVVLYATVAQCAPVLEQQTLERIGSVLGAKFTQYMSAVQALGKAYVAEGVVGYDNSTAGFTKLQNWAMEVKAVQDTLGDELVYAYTTYKLPSGKWGVAGCERFAAITNCYYTNQDAMDVLYDGAMIGSSSMISEKPVGQNDGYILDIVAQTVAQNTTGTWIRPDAWYSVNNRMTVELVSYSFPLQFDNNGSTVLAMTFDLSTAAIRQLLATYEAPASGSEVVMIDFRNNGTFLASSLVTGDSAGFTQLYTPMETPVPRINQFMSTVYGMQNGTWNATSTFMSGGFSYVTAPFMSTWALFQRVPMTSTADVAAMAVMANLSSVMQFADNLHRVYKDEMTTCYDAAQVANTTQFLQAAWAQQTQLGGSVVYAYVSYEIPNTNGKWGDCGCERFGPSAPVNCYYSDLNGIYHNFNGTDFTKETNSQPYAGEESAFIKTVMQMTMADMWGVWSKPYIYTDPNSNISSELLTYTIPLSFNMSTGKAISAMSIDIRVDSLVSVMKPNASSTSDYVLFDGRNGLFLASNLANWTVPNTTFWANMTPSTVVNGIVSNGIAEASNNTMRAVSYDIGITLYNLRPIYNAFVIIERVGVTPMAFTRANEAAQGMAAFLSQKAPNMAAMAAALGQLYVANNVDCTTTGNSTWNFLRTTRSLQMSLGAATKYYFVSYKTSQGLWGSCGCGYDSQSMTLVDCFRADANGSEWGYTGATTPNGEPPGNPSQNDPYLLLTASLTNSSANASGVWYEDSWYNPYYKRNEDVFSYTLPLQYDANGKCILAVGLDVDVSSLKNALQMATPNGLGGEMAFVDSANILPGTMTPVILATSQTTFSHALFQPMATSFSRVNEFMSYVYNGLNMSWTGAASFEAGHMWYETVPWMGRWTIALRIPTSVAAATAAATINTAGMSLVQVAQTLAALYVNENMPCYAAAQTMNTTRFLTLTEAFQQAMGPSVMYAYVSYALPGSNGQKWGDCGCESWDTVSCYYSDVNGTYHSFNGSNFAAETSAEMYAAEEEDYIQVIQNLTVANASGVWQPIYMWGSTPLISFNLPIKFDPITGKCILAISIDMRADSVRPVLKQQTMTYATNMILLDLRQGGLFVTSANHPYPMTQIMSATETYSASINAIDSAAFSALGGTFNKSLGFSVGGTLYNTNVFGMGQLVVIGTLGPNPASFTANTPTRSTALLGMKMRIENRLMGIVQSAKALAGAYAQQGVVGYDNSTTGIAKIKAFVTEVMSMQRVYGNQIVYGYVTYALPTPGMWGNVGCERFPTSGTVDCAYVGADGTQFKFNGVNVTGTPRKIGPFTQNANYLREITSQTKAQNGMTGLWLSPDVWNDTTTGTIVELFSFSWPFMFDNNGRVTAAMTFDISSKFVRQVMMENQNALSSEALFIDSRNGGTLIASSQSSSQVLGLGLYRPTMTPSPRINLYASLVWTALGNSWLGEQQFTITGMTYQTTTIMGTYALYMRSTLQSEADVAVTALEANMTGVMQLADNLRRAYLAESMTCEQAAATMSTTTFLQEAFTMQSSFGYSILYAYVSYEVAPGQWGDCGCERFAANASVNCYYTDSQQRFHKFFGANFSAPDGVPETIPTEMYGYTQAIMNMTAANAAGVWGRPNTFTDPVSNITTNIMSFTIPMAFNATTGKATLAVSIDIRVDAFKTVVAPVLSDEESLLVFIDARDSLFLASNVGKFDTAVPGQPAYSATMTPDPMVNWITQSTWTNLDNTFMRSNSFLIDDMLFNVRNFLHGVFTFIEVRRNPGATNYMMYDATRTASAYLGQRFNGAESLTQMLGRIYTGNQVMCDVNATAADVAKTAMFLNATYHMIMGQGFPVSYLHMTYKSQGTGTWGDCGCFWNPNSMSVNCFTTNANGWESVFAGSNMSAPLRGTQMNPNLPQLQLIAGLTKNDTAGVWFENSWYDNAAWAQRETLSFVLPIAFDSNGSCIAAASIDVDVAGVQNVLHWSTWVFGPLMFNGAEAIMIDSMNVLPGMWNKSPTFVASSNQVLSGALYSPDNTPSVRLNDFAVHTYANLENAWVRPGRYADVYSNMGYEAVSLRNRWTISFRAPLAAAASVVASAVATTGGNFAIAAASLGVAYLYEGQTCYAAAATMNTTNFLTLVSNLQQQLGASAVYAYTSYALPGTNNTMWGDCGCQQFSAGQVDCFYSDTNQSYHVFNGTNFNAQTSSTLYVAEAESYIKQIRMLTRANASGAWLVPHVYTDPVANATFVLTTFTVPLAFDPVTGLCTLAMSVDFTVDAIQPHMDMAVELGYASHMIVLFMDSPNTALFVGEGYSQPQNPATNPLSSGVYPAMRTPSDTVNSITSAAYYQLGNTFNSTLSFSQNSAVYNAIVIGQYVVVGTYGSEPGTISADTHRAQDLQALIGSLNAQLDNYVRAVKAIGSLYMQEGVVGYDNSTAGLAKIGAFLAEVQAAQQAYGNQLMYSYVTYALPTPGLWGNIGCTNAQLSPTHTVDCSYVGADGTQFTFNGANVNSTPVTVNMMVQGANYLKEITSQTQFQNGMTGRWLSPDSWSDTNSGIVVELISFSFPLAFNSNGTASVAMTFDLSTKYIRQFIAQQGHMPGTETLLIDVMNGNKFVTSSVASSDELGDMIYQAMRTPSDRINQFASTVYTELGNTFWASGNTSFTTSGLDYHTGMVMGVWGIYQRTPVSFGVDIAMGSMSTNLSNTLIEAFTLSTTYSIEGTTCYDAAQSMNTTKFLQSVRAAQMALGGSIVYAYVSYALPGTNNTKWGDCGCQQFSAGQVDCYYSDRAGTYHVFNGSNFNAETSATPYAAELEQYIQNIQMLTPAQRSGYWQPAQVYKDPVTGESFELLSISIPMAFDRNTGVCIQAMTIDLKMQSLSGILAQASQGRSDIVMIDNRGAGTFLTASSALFDTTKIYSIRNTPNPTVNAVANFVYSQIGTLTRSLSFPMGGTLIGVRAMGWIPFTIIERNTHPGTINIMSSQAIYATSLGMTSSATKIQTLAQQVASLYMWQGVQCYSNSTQADMSKIQALLEEVYSMSAVSSSSLGYINVAYAIPSTSLWGNCGCGNMKGTTHCYAAGMDGVEVEYNAFLTSMPIGSQAADQSAAFLKIIRNLTAANASGVWFEDSWYDTAMSMSMQTVTYILPIAFGSDGRCTTAITIDVPLATIKQSLGNFAPPGSEVVFYDTMNPYPGAWAGPTLVATSEDYFMGGLYRPTMTPSVRVNEFVNNVYMGLGNMWMGKGNFVSNNMWYEVMPWMNRWMLAIRFPTTSLANVAQSIISTSGQTLSTVTRTLGNTYNAEMNPCYMAAQSMNSTRFLRMANAMQTQLGSNVVYMYVSYALPGTNGHKWGDCGCQQFSAGQVDCFYSDTNGTYHVFNGTNFNAQTSATPYAAELYQYIQEIRKMQPSDMSMGVWQPAQIYTDPVSGVTNTIITHSYPLSFDTNNMCDVAISVDFLTTSFSNVLAAQVNSGYSSNMFIVDTRNGTFITSARHQFDALAVYPATSTPNAAVNAMLNTTWNNLNNTFNRTLSFSAGPTLYNARTIANGVYAVVDTYGPEPAVPLTAVRETQGLQAVQSALEMRFMAYNTLAKTIGRLYNQEGVVGYDNSTAGLMKMTNFLTELVAVQQAYAGEIIYAFVTYQLPNGMWGNIGTQPGANLSNVESFYTDTQAMYHDFRSANVSGSSAYNTYPFTQPVQYLSEIVSTPAGGRFNTPLRVYNNLQETAVTEFMYYTIPFGFNANGTGNLFASVIVDPNAVRAVMQQAAGMMPGREVLLINTATPLVLVSTVAAGYELGESFVPPNKSPNSRIAAFASIVWAGLGNSWSGNSSFVASGMSYQTVTIPNTPWALWQRGPITFGADVSTSAIASNFSDSMMAAAELARTYMAEGTTCYNAATFANTTKFLQATRALQMALGESVVYAYVSYALPGSNGTRWGDCGCQQLSAGVVNCYYSDANGTAHNFNGSNFAAQTSSYPFPAESYQYTQEIMAMTNGAGMPGRWQMPQTYTDPDTMQSNTLVTWSLPLAFDPVTGKALLAVSIDIKLSHIPMLLGMAGAVGPMSNSMLVDVRGQGTFLGATMSTISADWLYLARSTPDPMINMIANLVYNELGSTFNASASFSMGGALINVRALGEWAPFAVIEFVPVPGMSFVGRNQAIMAAAASLNQRINNAMALAQTIGSLYVAQGVTCSNADMNTMTFLEAVQGLQTSFGFPIAFLQMTYKTSNGTWGSCGCMAVEHAHGMGPMSNHQNGHMRPVLDCFVGSASGVETVYHGTNFSMPVATWTPNQTSPYIQQIAGISSGSMSASGVWSDNAWTVQNMSRGVVKFTLPIAFDNTGKCTLAASIDIDMHGIEHILGWSTMPGWEMAIVDAWNTLPGSTGPTFVASSAQAFEGMLYNPMNTPSPRINNFMSKVYAQLNNSWTGMTSFTDNYMNYDVMTMNNRWMFALRSPVSSGADIAAAAIVEGGTSMINAARSLGNLYMTEGTTCYQAASVMNTTRFLNAANALQAAIGGSAVYAYVSYLLPGGQGKWGDCGCEQYSANTVNCYYSDTAGIYHTFNGTNFAAQTGANPYAAETQLYIQQIAFLTQQSADGVWLAPTVWTDPISNQTRQIQTFTIPLAFDSTTGYCTLAVSIDFTLDMFQPVMQQQVDRGYTSNLFLLDSRNGGRWLAGANYQFPVVGTAPYYATATPSDTVNAITAAAAPQLNGTWAMDLSFNVGAACFNSRGFAQTYSVLGVVGTEPASTTPHLLQTEDLAAAQAYLETQFTNYKAIARTLGDLWTAEMVNGTDNSTAGIARLMRFAAEAQAIQQAYGNQIVYSYVSYPIANGVWGNAGCQRISGTVDCSYVDSDGMQHRYSGSNFNAQPISVKPFVQGAYLQQIASQTLNTTGWNGLWLSPDSWKDSMGMVWELFSYSYPISFDSNGKVNLAVTIDFSTAALQSTLNMIMPRAAAEMMIVDVRGSGAFIASSAVNGQSIGGAIYTPTATPNVRINQFAASVWYGLGGSWSGSGSFTTAGMSYQTVSFMGVWGLYVRTPVEFTANVAAVGVMANMSNTMVTAMALAQTYADENITCYDAAQSMNTTKFLRATRAMQLALGSSVVYAYVSYALPNSNGAKWGDCGCQQFTAGQVDCFYSDVNATYHVFNGSNFNAQTSATPYAAELYQYIQEIRSITKGMNVMWQNPQVYTDPNTGMTHTLITVSIPIAWDPIFGNVTAAMSLDVRLDALDAMLVRQAAAANTNLLLLDARNGGKYLASSFANFGMTTIYNAFTTPSTKANVFASQALAQTGSFMASQSFSAGSVLFNVQYLNFVPFTLIEANNAPGTALQMNAQLVQAASTQLSQYATHVQALASAMGSIYQSSNTQCSVNATQADMQMTFDFLGQVRNIAHSFGVPIKFVQMTYKSTSGVWGNCGCMNEFTAPVAGGNAMFHPGIYPTWNSNGNNRQQLQTDCYYTDSDGTARLFNGTNMSAQLGSMMITQNSSYIQVISNLSSSLTSKGIWFEAKWTDVMNGAAMQLFSFAIPVAFDNNGLATVVANIDVDVSGVMELMSQFVPIQGAEMLFADTMNPTPNAQGLNLVASSEVSFNNTWNPMTTPSTRINDFATIVGTQLNNMTSNNYAVSWTYNGMQYNAATWWNRFVFVVRAPIMAGGGIAQKAIQSLGNNVGMGVATLLQAYVAEGTTCYNAAMFANTTKYLQVAQNLQRELGASIVYTYVSYLLPGGNGQWGDCGCQQFAPGKVDCFYSDVNGIYHVFNGTDFSKETSSTPYAAELEQYIQEIQTMNRSTTSLWQTPQFYKDPVTGVYYGLQTISVPIAFDPVTGLCTLAVSIDFTTEYVRPALQSPVNSGYSTNMLFIDTRQTTFIASALYDFDFYTNGTVNQSAPHFWPALQTPSSDINAITVPAYARASYTSTNELSFSVGNSLFNLRSVNPNWVLIDLVNTSAIKPATTAAPTTPTPPPTVTLPTGTPAPITQTGSSTTANPNGTTASPTSTPTPTPKPTSAPLLVEATLLPGADTNAFLSALRASLGISNDASVQTTMTILWNNASGVRVSVVVTGAPPTTLSTLMAIAGNNTAQVALGVKPGSFSVQAAPPSASPPEESGLSSGALIGIIVGGVVLLVIIGAVLFMVTRPKTRYPVSMPESMTQELTPLNGV